MPPKPPADKIALYQALLDTHPEIEMKGKNMLFTSANGYMFSMLTKDGRWVSASLRRTRQPSRRTTRAVPSRITAR